MAHDNLECQKGEGTLCNQLGRNDQGREGKASAADDLRAPSFVVQMVSTEPGATGILGSHCFAKNQKTTEIKLYKKRFWILALFSLYSMLNAMQWVQYTVVSDATICFYEVSIYAVNWTANLFYVMFLPLMFPAAWFIEKAGIRNSMLLGSFLTCLSTIIQCLTTGPGTFNLVLVSQALSSVAQSFFIPLPPYISATWFGAKEVSIACAIGLFGREVGCALSFIITPTVMSTDCANKALISRGKKIVAYSLLTCNFIVFLLILAYFDDKPKMPPSLAQANKPCKAGDFKRSVCALLKNKNFNLLLIANGLCTGVSLGIDTILYSLISKHFPGNDKIVGLMGLTMILGGTVGSILTGYILDRTHKFRETFIAVLVCSFLVMMLFAGILYVNVLWVQFITKSIYEFFMFSIAPVGLEFAVEITYPEPESASSTLINASGFVFGLLFALTGTHLVESFNDLAANGFFSAILLFGAIISAFIKCDFRRQEQEAQFVS